MAYQYWGSSTPGPKSNGSNTPAKTSVPRDPNRPLATPAPEDVDSDPKVSPLIRYHAKTQERDVARVKLDIWKRVKAKLDD